MELDSNIPYGRQNISKNDIEAVIKVLKSDYLTQGPCVPKFENAIAKYCNADYAVAVNSATSALHLACLSLGLSNGDWLWTSSITFVASANCGLYCGAKVDYVDIDPSTYNLCPKALEKKLIKARETGKLPKVVIPVHLCGQSCDMKAISKLAKQYGFKIIEDASHAIGGKYIENPIGSCIYSDITVFSFHPVKIITTGEGEIALTNDSEIAEHMTLLRSHGVSRDPGKMKSESPGDWYYEQVALGFNYRMTDIEAALGLSQLKRLDDNVLKRHKLVKRYNNLLAELPLILPFQKKNVYSSFHLYVIRIKDSSIHQKVFEHLRKNNIGVNIHYIPLHMHPYQKKINGKNFNLKQAELYYKSAISIPLYPSMTKNQQDRVVSILSEALTI
jgi:UDP-4-amino-4,6-dideoxy-N-acetyl-beta-L-altrosamine transaminase